VQNLLGKGYTEEGMGRFSHLLQWVERIADKPAVKRGIGKKYTS
jgi:hypothetical protein